MADKYPEHEKLDAISVEREAVQGFLDWLLDEHHATICKPHEHDPYVDHQQPGCYETGKRMAMCGLSKGEYVPIFQSRERYLGDFFGIDPVKLEAEKRAMLDELRAAQGLTS